MVPFTLKKAGFTTKVAWGVNYSTEDRLFVFYQTPDSCAAEGVSTNCLIINSGSFYLTTTDLDIPEDSRLVLSFSDPEVVVTEAAPGGAERRILEGSEPAEVVTLTKLMKIYPATLSHDLPALRRVDPNCIVDTTT